MSRSYSSRSCFVTLCGANQSVVGPIRRISFSDYLWKVIAMLSSQPSTPSAPRRSFAASAGRSAIRADALKSTPHFPNLSFNTFAKWATSRLRNLAPVLVLTIFVAGWRPNQLSVHLLPCAKALTTLCNTYWRGRPVSKIFGIARR